MPPRVVGALVLALGLLRAAPGGAVSEERGRVCAGLAFLLDSATCAGPQQSKACLDARATHALECTRPVMLEQAALLQEAEGLGLGSDPLGPNPNSNPHTLA